MKKRFDLIVEDKNPQRVLESIKNEIRKYIKREKRKSVPDGVDFWKIECQFAINDEELQPIKFEDIIKSINDASAANAQSFIIELLATEGLRKEQKIEIADETADINNDESSDVSNEENSDETNTQTVE